MTTSVLFQGRQAVFVGTASPETGQYDRRRTNKPKTGDLWLDMNATPAVLKYCSDDSTAPMTWIPVGATAI